MDSKKGARADIATRHRPATEKRIRHARWTLVARRKVSIQIGGDTDWIELQFCRAEAGRTSREQVRRTPFSMELLAARTMDERMILP